MMKSHTFFASLLGPRLRLHSRLIALACLVHGCSSDPPPDAADQGAAGSISLSSVSSLPETPSRCGTTVIEQCTEGQVCSLYCADGAVMEGCRQPDPQGAALGESCESKPCREGACIEASFNGQAAQCLAICKRTADCPTGTHCTRMMTSLTCGAGSTAVSDLSADSTSVAVCRPLL